MPALEAQNLVGDLDRPVVADKEVLVTLLYEPTRGYLDIDQQTRMARALARKYDRFAFPDAFNAFVKPLAKRFKDKHQRENSEEGKHLHAIAEIRVIAEPDWKADSVTLLFYLVLLEPYADAEWSTWTDKWTAKLSQTSWISEVHFQVITLKNMSAHDYLSSQLLDFENLSLPRE